MVNLSFVKAHGAGNDFVLLNNMDGRIRIDPGALARILCDRRFGVGGDGLLILEQSLRANFCMRYFNADGSTGGMCGNGGRCSAKYAYLAGIAPESMTFEALDYVYRAKVRGASVSLNMKDPTGIVLNSELDIGGTSFKVSLLDTGSPHAVLFVGDLEGVDVPGLGARLRHHDHLKPGGANINFVCRAAENDLSIRTYERGVEAETLACGTGSVASSVVGALLGIVRPPVTIHTRSGVRMVVDFKLHGHSVTEVTLEGPAEITFGGNVVVDIADGKLMIPALTDSV